MATELFSFGIKYRLVVGDVEGTDWKIEIEEKDFSGNATNFIGDGTAFEITWENNEDYDKSIIGSYCKINIMAKPVLDSGTPDFSELFTKDETKYRVKIYYDTNPSEFLANYQLYWQGFIVQDEYVEEVTSDPYRISVLATENFGKLKSFPYKDNDPTKHEEYDTPAKILYEALSNIGLAIDVYDLSGLYTNAGRLDRGTVDAVPFLEQVEIAAENYLKGDSFLDYHDYFSILDSYLKSINCFMIQSYGELYIVDRSSYHSVINGSFDWDAYKLTFGASSFSSASFPSVDLPINLGVDIPSQVRVLNRSLIKTRKAAKQQTSNNYDIGLRNLFYNGSFELNADPNGNVYGWFGGFSSPSEELSFNSPTPFVSELNSSITGNRSLRCAVQSTLAASNFESANTATRCTTYTEAQISTDYDTDSAGNDVNAYARGVPYEQDHSSGEAYELQGELSFKVYIPNGASPMPVLFRHSISWNTDGSIYGDFFDYELQEWASSHSYATEVIEETGVWVEIKKTLPFPVSDGTQISEGDVTFRVHIVSPETGSPSGGYFLDDVSLKISQPEGSEDAITTGTNSFVASVENDEANEGSEISTVSVLGGITRFNIDPTSASDLFERTDLLLGKVEGQYVDPTVTSGEFVTPTFWYYDRDPQQTSPSYIPRTLSLQEIVNEHRWDEAQVTQDYIEGNLKNITATTGTYVPITPLDTLQMSFRSGTYDTKHYNIVRMTFNPRNNLINFVARNIVETQGTYSES